MVDQLSQQALVQRQAIAALIEIILPAVEEARRRLCLFVTQMVNDPGSKYCLPYSRKRISTPPGDIVEG